MAVLRILGRTVVVTLLIVTLVMVAFAQEGPGQTPAVVVNNQALVNGTLTIGPVTVPQQAFLVIQRDASGAAGAILGRVAIQTGTTETVVVPLDVAVAPGEQLYAALYLDAAPVGVLEAPGADTPLLVNNQPVAQPFTITAENAPPVQATLSPTQTPPVLITTQPLIQPTLTVPGPVTTPVTFTTTVTPTVPIVSPTLVSTPQATPPGITQPVTQTVAQTGTQPLAQPTSPLPTPLPPVPTLAPTLAPPTVTPTSQPATPTQAPTVQLFFPQLIQPLTPTPASMPMTGANGTTNLPTTLLLGALTFVLFVGGDRLRQRWNRRG